MIGTSSAQDDEAETLTLSADTHLLIEADSFLFSVAWEPDGALTVSPDWIIEPGKLPFENMETPPRIRTRSEQNATVGEFALQDGSWSTLFSIPNGTEDKPVLTDLTPAIEDMLTGHPLEIADQSSTARLVQPSSIINVKNLQNNSSSAPIVNAGLEVPLQASVEGIISRSANRLLLYVDALNGNDAWDGRAAPSSETTSARGRAGHSGPAKSLQKIVDTALSAPDAEVEIVLSPGIYYWQGMPDHEKRVIITPLEGVTIATE